MIRLEDLEEAIAECQGVRNPNAQICMKLAAFLTIKDQMFANANAEQSSSTVNNSTIDSVNIDNFNNRSPRYSYAYESDTEFAKLAATIDNDALMEIIDELMTVLEATNPRLYRGVMRKILDRQE